MVTVHIRPPNGDKTTFALDKDLICKNSAYFEAAFNSDFSEAATQELEIEDVDIEIFRIFVHWLHKGKLVGDDENRPSYTTLVKIWLFADSILAPKLQNLVIYDIDQARYEHDYFPSARLHLVYDNTAEGSPLRRLIVDTWNFTYRISTPENYPHQFLVDLINNSLPKENPGRFRPCKIAMVAYLVDEEAVMGNPARRKMVSRPETEKVAKKTTDEVQRPMGYPPKKPKIEPHVKIVW